MPLGLKIPRIFGMDNERSSDLCNIFHRNARYCIYFIRRKSLFPSLEYFVTLVKDEIRRKYSWSRLAKYSSDPTALRGYPIVKMEIRYSKFFNSKCLVFAQFWSKYDNSSADWWKTRQNFKEKYSHHIFVQNEAVIGKKPVPGVCETSNSSHKQIISWQEKNLKIIFFTGVRNIVKMGSEIYKYLSSFFHSAKYLMLF